MIKSVKIENYKSIQELEVDVGRFNVIIGENGAGKSNFLEALALFGAAEADKLDNEFLVSKGIRVCAVNLMTSNFINKPVEQDNTSKTNYYIIKIHIRDNINKKQFIIIHNNMPYSKWLKIDENPLVNTPQILHLRAKIQNTAKLYHSIMNNYEENNNVSHLQNFIIYTPENTALRNFYREGQIEPLGINGEGLLKLLKVMQESEPAAFQDVLNCLELFDWFETIDVPKDLSSMEDKVSIKDKYLTTIFDQRSANEGFLFVLFYAALFCSQYTPKIFAIDNIDASFNPKLCTVLIKKLVELAKKYDKQVFVTTHNPAILDGVDLGDEEQKLFVASRNKQGHTRFKTLTLADKPKSSTGEPIRLSEAFLRGYLGGLPKNF